MPWWKKLFIITYLIVQVALPLRGFLYDNFTTRGNFTWNMYSMIYGCGTQYRLDTPQGETRWLRYKDYFKLPNSAPQVFYIDVLPEFHRWLCDKFQREGTLGTLRGYTTCSLNYGREVALMDHNVDLCTAPNYGVKVQAEVIKE